jgi:hypothetical protein
VKGLRLAATDCRNGTNPFEFVGTANVPPLEQRKIGLGKLQVLMCAYVPSAGGFAFEAGVSGELTFDALGVTKLFAAKGSATGWFQGAGSARSLLRTDFNLDGSFQLQIPVIGTIGATGVLSSEGYAFCGQYGFISTGLATHNWIDPPTDLTGCDFTPYRVATQPPLPTARIARAGKRVKVVAGQTAVAVALSGAATAPRVRVRGPHGEGFVTPRGSTPLKTRAAIIVPIDELHTTYIYLHRPAAGQWRFDPLAGSAPIGRLRTASQVPRPRVRARLKLKAGKATLRWQARPIRGQQIQLVDRAGAGVATVVQPTTGHSHGTIHFRPVNPLATRRRIEAVVLQNGVPRATLTVAHYHIKRPARPGRVSRVKATRTATGLAITWRRARHARDYVISVTQGSTVLTRTVTTGTALTFESPPAGPLAVVIQPRDALERTGPASTLAVP